MKKIVCVLLYFYLGAMSFQKVFGQNKSASVLLKIELDKQAKLKDSLLSALKNKLPDTTELNIYLKLCETSEAKDVLKYAENIIKISDKLLVTAKDSAERKKILKKKITGFENLNQYYTVTEGPGSLKALELLKKALTLSEEIKDEKFMAVFRIAIADYYRDQGNIMKQLENLQEGFEFSKKRNYKNNMSRFILQLTFLYADQGDTLQVLNYLEKGIALEKEINDSTRKARGLVLKGDIYSQILRYDKAIDCYKLAIAAYTVRKEKDRIVRIYLGMGNTYLQKGDYIQALNSYQACENLAKEIDDISSIFWVLIAKGELYQKKKDFESSLNFHKEALAIAEQANLDDAIITACVSLTKDYFAKKDFKNAKINSERVFLLMKNSYAVQHVLEREKLAYKIDSAANNYKDAYSHYQRYILLKDKLNTEDLRKAAAKEKFQNDLEKQRSDAQAEQDKKDSIANEEKQKQKIIIYSISAGLFLVLLLVVFVFRSSRQKQKANTELLAKNDVIARQKHLVEEKHKEITDSINYAERIQRSFLATKELLDKHLKDYFIFFKPKDVVSGDFYCAATLSDGNFALVTADSTGHGVPGAIMSLLNITSLEKAIEYHTNPAEILNHTRKTIINRLKKDGSAEGGKDGMDCSLIVFDRAKNQLHIAAAHNPVWIIRTSRLQQSIRQAQEAAQDSAASYELSEIKADKMPVGKHDKDKEPFTLHTIDLQKGDLIYAITDGFSDQFGGPNGKKFMSKNLKELLLKNASLSMEEQKKLIEDTFQNWISTYEQVDDVTLIGIHV